MNQLNFNRLMSIGLFVTTTTVGIITLNNNKRPVSALNTVEKSNNKSIIANNIGTKYDEFTAINPIIKNKTISLREPTNWLNLTKKNEVFSNDTAKLVKGFFVKVKNLK